MATANLSAFLRRLTRGMAAEALADQSDRQLVERAVAGREETVFEAIVRRHGPMVYRVCWRVLQQDQDAEDAFQATFLVLAQKLRTIRKHTSLASWLHGVAYRVALKAKAQAATRRRHEHLAAVSPAVPPDEVTWKELCAVLDAELAELPEKWRQPLILCYLEGQTQDEAAGQLGWSKITLRRRLDEARVALGRRLNRRGIIWPAALSAILLSDCVASATIPPSLVASTVDASIRVAAGRVVAGIVSANVTALTEGVLKTMLLTKLKIATAVLLVVAVVALGGSSLLSWSWATQDAKPAPAAAQKPAEQDDKKPADDREKIQGTWDLVSVVEDGKEKKPQAEKGKQKKFIFTEDRLFMKEGDRVSLDIQTYHLDQKARAIDLDRVERPGEKMLLGIYLLEGDTLKICLGLKERPPERPTQFVSKPGSATALLVFKRSAVAEKIDKDWARAQEEWSKSHSVIYKSLVDITVALFKYAEDKGQLPPAAIHDKEGKPLLSWRVAILPYLGQDDLYRQFKLEEPWDSEHNKKLLAQMPQVYAPPVGIRTKEDHVTFYQVFTGPGTAFEGKEGIKQDDFPDGPNTTILLVKGGEAVPWTKPADLPFDPGKPLPKLATLTLFEGGFYIMPVAGGSRFVRPGFDEKVLRAAITRNGGESASLEDLNKR